MLKSATRSPNSLGKDGVSWTEEDDKKEDDKKEDAVEDDVVSWEVSRT